MKLLDWSFDEPERNLALDEALLDAAEEAESAKPGGGIEVLRFWESSRPFAVLGYSRKAAEDLKLETCREDGVPVFRRASGGGTVLQGPGCLNFSLVFRLDRAAELRTIRGTNEWVLGRTAAALASEAPGAAMRGISDLALDGKKFGGTAQRRKRAHALFHGTVLYAFDLSAIEKYVAHPPAKDEPDYRQGRAHADFLTQLPLPAARIKRLIALAWDAREPHDDVKNLEQAANALAGTRYSQNEWNFKF